MVFLMESINIRFSMLRRQNGGDKIIFSKNGNVIVEWMVASLEFEISKNFHSGTMHWYYQKFLFAFSDNQFYNYTNGTANHFHIIL